MKLIQPASISGSLKAPDSKSMLQRYIALASCTPASTRLNLKSDLCQDAKAAINCAEALGADVSYANSGQIVIRGLVHAPKDTFDCQESGLSLRMFAPLSCLYGQSRKFIACGTLLKRTLDPLSSALSACGLKVESDNGEWPIIISGQIKAGNYLIEAGITSQVLTGLLITLAQAKGSASKIVVPQLVSMPYIEMTIEAIRLFGLSCEADFESKVFSLRAQQVIAQQDRVIEIEGDWSAAAFFLVAGAVAGEVVVENLSLNSRQADIAILDILKLAGAKIQIEESWVKVGRSSLKAFEFDVSDCPDLFPALVVLAANCQGVSNVYGTSRLQHKESNRIEVLASQFGQLGLKIELLDNHVRIHGAESIRAGVVATQGDHRIAMAAAILGLNAREPVMIDDQNCVAKSFPEFFSNIQRIIKQ